jgi:hypothetical protein
MKKIVKIRFCDSFNTDRKNYSYLTDDETIEKDDVVVVSSGPGLGLGKVVAVGTPGRATNWVVQKVDMDAFKKRREQEEKVKGLKLALQLKKEQFDEMAVFQLLAEKDPEAKQMLDELAELTA